MKDFIARRTGIADHLFCRRSGTLIRIYEELRGLGYDGGYDAVRRYARRWAKEQGQRRRSLMCR